MNVFSDTFIEAVDAELSKLSDKDYVTAANLAIRIGVDLAYSPVITFAVNHYFPAYEGVRSKGIRRKKETEA